MASDETATAADAGDEEKAEEKNEDTPSAADHGDDAAKDEGEDSAAKTIQVLACLLNSLARANHCFSLAQLSGLQEPQGNERMGHERARKMERCVERRYRLTSSTASSSLMSSSSIPQPHKPKARRR
jgi:hypothetical protein